MVGAPSGTDGCPSPRYAIDGLVVEIRSNGKLRPDEKVIRDASTAKLSPLPAVSTYTVVMAVSWIR